MEPVTLIVTALVAGATAVANEVGGQALKDAYTGLKTLVVDRYKGAKSVVELAENNPDSADMAQAAEAVLTDAGAADDQDLITQAEQVNEELATQEKANPGSTIITVSGSGAVAVNRSTAAGAGGIAIGGSVKGNVSTGKGKDE